MTDEQNQQHEQRRVPSPRPGPISVKGAVARAMQYVREVYEQPFPDLLLEEVDKTDDGDYWLITVSFGQPDPSPLGTIRSLAGVPNDSRLYKVVKIDADTGEPLSMKIRRPFAVATVS